MSHCIVYCVFVDGQEFNSLLPEDESIKEAEFDEYLQNDLRLDFCVPNTDAEILGEITGRITLLWTPWVYSKLLNSDNDTAIKVSEWERYFLKLVTDLEVFRIDEILLEQWESKQGDEYWFRDKGCIDNFRYWLQQQEVGHWSKIN